VATAVAPAQIAFDRSLMSELGVQGKALDRPAAPRHPQVETAQRLGMEPGNCAESYVNIDILGVLLRLISGRPCHHRFDEAPSVVNIAEQHDPQSATGTPFRFEQRLVAIGKIE